jgi:hypothetical protein
LTDGLYPERWRSVPTTSGTEAQKSRTSARLKIVEEREKFSNGSVNSISDSIGGPVTRPRGSSYRTDPYIWMNTEPRFLPVDPGCGIPRSEAGWATEGHERSYRRGDVSEVRAVAITRARCLDALIGDRYAAAGGSVSSADGVDGARCCSSMRAGK